MNPAVSTDLPVSMCRAAVRLLEANWNFVVVAELPLEGKPRKVVLVRATEGCGGVVV